MDDFTPSRHDSESLTFDFSEPTSTKLYQAWRGVLNRCYRPATKRYERYGGRGITVCDRWRFGADGKSAFECFKSDMGEPPAPDHSIDRIDPNGNYEPSNCRWITMAEQARNKTSNRWLSGFGKTQLMEDWSREYSICPSLLHMRLKKGMSIEEAVTFKHIPKTTPEDFAAIRAIHAAGTMTYQQMADQYGISKSMVKYIITQGRK